MSKALYPDCVATCKAWLEKYHGRSWATLARLDKADPEMFSHGRDSWLEEGLVPEDQNTPVLLLEIGFGRESSRKVPPDLHGKLVHRRLDLLTQTFDPTLRAASGCPLDTSCECCFDYVMLDELFTYPFTHAFTHPFTHWGSGTESDPFETLGALLDALEPCYRIALGFNTRWTNDLEPADDRGGRPDLDLEEDSFRPSLDALGSFLAQIGRSHFVMRPGSGGREMVTWVYRRPAAEAWAGRQLETPSPALAPAADPVGVGEPNAIPAERYLEIVESCEEDFDLYGDSYQGAGWTRSEAHAEARYRVALDLIPETSSEVTMLDFGCGTSRLNDYLESTGRTNIRYSGLDLSARVLEVAREKYPDVTYYCQDVLDSNTTLAVFDYVVLNGVFNYRGSMTFESMLEYQEALLLAIAPSARKGLAFNVMSKHVDWERDDLFHLPMSRAAGFLSSKISPRLVFRHDYGQYEYMVYVYR